MTDSNHQIAHSDIGTVPLTRVFNPRNIAIVGASNSVKKPGYNLVNSLKIFEGDVFPINPSAAEVQGFKAYPNLNAVGRDIDLVILCVPAKAILETLEKSADIRIAGCMIVTSGFSETGAEGDLLQQRVSEICAQRGIRVIGPNTAGFMNPSKKLFASFVPELDRLKPGNVGIVSQSGAMNMVLSFLSNQCDLGISLAIGLGNMMDLGHADIVSYLADDPTTDVILVYAEGISEGRRLYEAIKQTVPKKPVIVLLVGKTDIEEFARSHTGNLIGSYALKKSILEQAGAIVVDSEIMTVDAARVFSKHRLEANENPGFGVISGQAGPAMIIIDKLKDNNLSVPELSDDSIHTISTLLPPLTFIKNPVDTGRPSPTFPDILKTVSGDVGIDAVITFALEEHDALEPQSLFKEIIPHCKTPMIFGTVGIHAERIKKTLSALNTLKIPAYPTPEQAANAAILLGLDAKRQAMLAELSAAPALPEYSKQTNLPPSIDEAQAKNIINQYGFSTPKRIVVHNHSDAKTALADLTCPVVVKVLDVTIQHKTEVGGVHININSEAELDEALSAIDRIKGDQGAYLMEEMAPPGIELILGATNDATFGPTIILGMGGTTAEAIGDVAMRAAPITRPEARDMIRQLRCASLLEGWRGAQPVDKQALIDDLVNLSLLISQHPQITEMDLNPVRVYTKGTLVLDALIQQEMQF